MFYKVHMTHFDNLTALWGESGEMLMRLSIYLHCAVMVHL